MVHAYMPASTPFVRDPRTRALNLQYWKAHQWPRVEGDNKQEEDNIHYFNHGDGYTGKKNRSKLIKL